MSRKEREGELLAELERIGDAAAKSIPMSDTRTNALQNLVNDQRRLLSCYRLNRRPSDVLLERIVESEKALADFPEVPASLGATAPEPSWQLIVDGNGGVWNGEDGTEQELLKLSKAYPNETFSFRPLYAAPPAVVAPQDGGPTEDSALLDWMEATTLHADIVIRRDDLRGIQVLRPHSEEWSASGKTLRSVIASLLSGPRPEAGA